jgi:hypothetical protein
MCAPRVIWHTSIRYSSSCHTRANMGAWVHTSNISSCQRKPLFQFSCGCEQFHSSTSFSFLVINIWNHGEHYETPCIIQSTACRLQTNAFFVNSHTPLYSRLCEYCSLPADTKRMCPNWKKHKITKADLQDTEWEIILNWTSWYKHNLRYFYVQTAQHNVSQINYPILISSVPCITTIIICLHQHMHTIYISHKTSVQTKHLGQFMCMDDFFYFTQIVCICWGHEYKLVACSTQTLLY